MGLIQSHQEGQCEPIKYKKSEIVTLKELLEETHNHNIHGIHLQHGLQLYNLIITTVALGEVSKEILETIEELGDGFSREENVIMDKLLSLDFETEPGELDDKVRDLLIKLVQEGDLSKFDHICISLKPLIENFGMILGDVLSIFLETNIQRAEEENVSKVVAQLINMGLHESFSLVTDFYLSLSERSREVLKSKSELRKFYLESLDAILQIVRRQSNEQSDQFDNVSEIYANRVLIEKAVLGKYRPAIQDSIDLLSKIIPLTFTILSINRFCTENLGTNQGPINCLDETSKEVTIEIKDGIVDFSRVPKDLQEKIEIINMDSFESSSELYRQDFKDFLIVISIRKGIAEILKAPAGINVVLEYY